jgi:hypothetical protein
MRQILENFGFPGLHGFSLAFLVGAVVILIRQRRSGLWVRIRGNILFLMLLESFAWGMFLYFLLLTWQRTLMMPSGITLLQQVVLAVGAGLYEELVFRVLLISGFVVALRFVFKWQSTACKIGAIFGAAVIFSLFHFMGQWGDIPQLKLFLIRFFAGLVLGGLYSLRGFGITAYAHGIYDLIVLTRIVTG